MAFGMCCFPLFGLAGCGSFFSAGPSEYEKYKKTEQSFSEMIAAAGGKATKENKAMLGFKMTGWLIELPGADISDKMIDQIIEKGQADPILQLNLSKSKITDDQLVRLDAAKVLERTVNLDLSDTAITDAGLDRLQRAYAVMFLNLKGSAATKAGAKRLGDKKIANPQIPAPFRKQPELKI